MLQTLYLSYTETIIESGYKLQEISNTFESAVNMSSFNTYIQQADNFITKQIHKFEQQKHENRSPPRAYGYNQMPQYPSRTSRDSYGRPPSQGYPGTQEPHDQSLGGRAPPTNAPPRWTQEYDARSQRCYYLERSTGRSQWTPPSCAPPRAVTLQPDVRMPSPREDWPRSRDRATSQPHQSGSECWNSVQGGKPARGTDSSSQGLHTQLPTGAHLDMKTGKVVTSMFPEGQTWQSWTEEIRMM
jgi:hypothetical protein